ncbi:MAG: T9SS type A sorting domain-containing protein [Bacteroidota bacterium]
MKKKLLLLFTLFASITAIAQTTFVPDDGLEFRLQQLGLDSGPLDDLVLTGNIDDLLDFDFGNFVVTDITGLQDFISLRELRISDAIADLSPIENLTTLEELVIRDVTDTSVDLSALVNLTFVSIARSPFTNLDFTNNTNLTEVTIQDMNNDMEAITFGNNPLLDDVFINNVNVPQLDFSNCPALRLLLANNNATLFNLDVTQCPLLESIDFDENLQLTYIDLSANIALNSVRAQDNPLLETIFIKSGNNTNIGQTFRVRDNASLTCIEVDDVAWSNLFWAFPTNNFSGFSATCSPSNDDCAQAVPITLVQPAAGTTLNATNSTNTPGCESSGITILDIWYEFPAPASGSVTMTINAPPLVGKIAIYASCGDATPIACQEGELAITGLTPNATYYLQVWLEAGGMNRPYDDVFLENSNGGFVLEVQDTTTLSVNDPSSQLDEIRMFPNPANDKLNISAPNFLEQVAIYDMSGKLIIKDENLRTNSQTIPLEKLSSGMYMVHIKTENSTTLKKLIIN